MKNINRLVVVCAVVMVVAAGSAFAGDGWQKLGNKSTVFKNGGEDIKIKKSDIPVGEIMFKVTGSTVEFTGVSLGFADGSSQEIEFEQDVEPGHSSDPIAIDDGPKAITSLHAAFKTADGKGSTSRAVITVVGK
jgi:hypothetical protein